MTARPRFFLSLFRIVVFLMIALSISPSTDHESAKGSNATASAAHDLLSVSVQETQAKKTGGEELKYCWKCTCPYHADSNKKRKGTWTDEGYVETDEDDRGGAESAAHEKCERQATGKNCYFWKCSCTGPKRRKSCN